MDKSLRKAIETVFRYPAPQDRQHGPRGYEDYTSYKPWLRDEFLFRCVYCLSRERWKPDGQHGFSADHINAQSTHPEQTRKYENLVYACCSCNSSHRDLPLPFHPEEEPLEDYVEFKTEGVARALTDGGQRLIDLCHLNRPALVAFRRNLLRLLTTLGRSDDPQAETAIQQLLGFPDDLPDLSRLRPPGGNDHPQGIAQSCHARRQRDELPHAY